MSIYLLNLFSSHVVNILQLTACEYLGIQWIKTGTSVDAHQEVATETVG